MAVETGSRRRVKGWRLAVPALAGVLALGVLPISPQQDTASAVGTIPVTKSYVDRQQEQRYLANVVDLLDEGINNRLNLNLALQARRPVTEYARLLGEFRERQLGLLLRLQELPTPPRLIPFHERVRSALITQTAFYAAFVAAKARDARIGFDTMLDHPAIRATSADLQAAWDHLRRLHPALDRRTEAAIEGRLSWLELL